MGPLPVLFVGTGIMGAPMAINLARNGLSVSAWNRSPEKVIALGQHGIGLETDLASLEPSRRVVILMLSTGPVCDEVLFGKTGQAGLVKALLPGSIVVVMSSIPVETAKEQARRLAGHGIDYVDAPVSGGELGAKNASLSIMAGGDEDVIARIRPVLEHLGKLTHVGPPGSGQLVKLANQTIVGITIGAVSEALILAEAGGADIAAARDALLGGFADSTILRQHGRRIIDLNFTPGAHAHVQLKDVRTAEALAKNLGLCLPLLAKTRSLYEGMCDTDLKQADHSALYLYLKDFPVCD